SLYYDKWWKWFKNLRYSNGRNSVQITKSRTCFSDGCSIIPYCTCCSSHPEDVLWGERREPHMKKTEENNQITIIGFSKYFTLIAAFIAMVLPLIVIVLGSFKESQEFRRTGPLVLPINFFNFENYITAFVS